MSITKKQGVLSFWRDNLVKVICYFSKQAFNFTFKKCRSFSGVWTSTGSSRSKYFTGNMASSGTARSFPLLRLPSGFFQNSSGGQCVEVEQEFQGLGNSGEDCQVWQYLTYTKPSLSTRPQTSDCTTWPKAYLDPKNTHFMVRWMIPPHSDGGGWPVLLSFWHYEVAGDAIRTQGADIICRGPYTPRKRSSRMRVENFFKSTWSSILRGMSMPSCWSCKRSWRKSSRCIPSVPSPRHRSRKVPYVT